MHYVAMFWSADTSSSLVDSVGSAYHCCDVLIGTMMCNAVFSHLENSYVVDIY